ncbi:MAG: hypothetical protein ACU0B9_13670 [Limimaricola soesokkakensis]|uniref:hypothetical protein n=2 Tax=Limimaricola soesokkakensis TaxID=1343159 RepID=UPI00405A1307
MSQNDLPPSPIEPLGHDSLVLRKMTTMDGKLDELLPLLDLLETETDPSGHGMLIRVHSVLREVQEELRVIRTDRDELKASMEAQKEEFHQMAQTMRGMAKLLAAKIST